MSFPMYLVDSFCLPDGGGNPGAVCLLADDEPSEWMQTVAAEMHQSETGFVRPRPDGTFALRWFTPLREVPLCGHVTLAAAHVLWVECRAEQSLLTFHTASGTLTAQRRAGAVEIDLPANPCTAVPAPSWLRPALGIDPVVVLAGRLKYLVVLPSQAAVASASPDFQRLRHDADRGVIVTAASDDPATDFVSRYFAGYVGVDEDPVTGSAHCCLVPYWSRELGKTTLRARQLSPRGGELSGRLRGDRVHLAGRTRTRVRGNWVA